MARLKGKVALITGGASGIGEATVRLFVEEGATVVLADIQDDRGRRLAAELGARAAYVHADVSSEVEVKSVIDETVRRFRRLDCLFNNAGYAGVAGRIEDIRVEGFDETLGVLLRGVFLGMKHAAPVMKRQGAGSIISTASVAGLRTGMGPHVYSTAKAAVIHLTRTVATELGESGVRVNCICPGGIATPIFGKAFGLTPERADETIPSTSPILAVSFSSTARYLAAGCSVRSPGQCIQTSPRPGPFAVRRAKPGSCGRRREASQVPGESL